jgi:SAM-dependent methyltransferase
MDAKFWNQRYGQEDYVYGTEPNEFYKTWIDRLAPGHALFAAEGEGRNAVYAAQLGWHVLAIDQSEVGKKKAINLAALKQVEIEYVVGDLELIDLSERKFDLIVLVYAHLSDTNRRAVHQKLMRFLNPGGHVILEAFSQQHPPYQILNPKVGGPRELSYLYTESEIVSDFSELKPVYRSTEVIELSEGPFHAGKGSVVRFVGKKEFI